MNPTIEQLAIVEAATTSNDSLVINAKAGSGKTSTLKLLVPKLRGSTILSAFNKAIVEELEAKIRPTLPAFSEVDIRTAHAAGLSAFRRNGRKPKTLGGKLTFMFSDMLKTVPQDDDVHRNARHVTKLCSYAKNAGFGLTSSASGEHFPDISDRSAWRDLIDHFDLAEEFEGNFDEDDCIDHALRLLRASNARQESIDFDDMIYLPLLLNLSIPAYDNVLVDEAQDINGTRRELLFRMMKPRGRMIAVGDPNQAIYGFTGADIASLQKIRDRAGAKELPLNICFRCDAAIIAEAQKIVPAIRARDNAAAGQVLTVEWNNGGDSGPRGEGHDFLALPKAGDAILCRLNKPNVAVALGLIRRGVPARIEGRDIGGRIVEHVKKANPLYASEPLADSLPSLDAYLEAETAKLMAKKRETQIAMLEDEVDAAKLLIERACEETAGRMQTNFLHLEALVDRLFGDNINSRSIVTLSSVHKSKGREWPRVFILGWADYMPFHIAAKRGGWALEQEHNLRYVAQTRAEQTLVYVNGVASAIDRGLHRHAPKASPISTSQSQDSWADARAHDSGL